MCCPAPKNVHIIIASRNHFLSQAEITKLCSRVCILGPKQLRLDKDDLAVYTRRCGADLTESQLQQLLYTTEGWISGVYLNLRTLADRGALPERGSDIYNLFTAAMIDPLPPIQQEFLTVLSLADEFTIEMAKAVTGRQDAAELLADLTTRNAFVKRLPDSDRYRCHHMMKHCAMRAFHKLSAEKQTVYYDRYGQWYEQHGHLLHAMTAYRACGDYDALLRVVERHRHSSGHHAAQNSPGRSGCLPKINAEGTPDCPAGADALYVQLASDSQNAGIEKPSVGDC